MDKTKKIAVNTIFLCFRMLVLMLISFYSSRVLLKELGVTDFGIYGLVGGLLPYFLLCVACLLLLPKGFLITKWVMTI